MSGVLQSKRVGAGWALAEMAGSTIRFINVSPETSSNAPSLGMGFFLM